MADPLPPQKEIDSKESTRNTAGGDSPIKDQNQFLDRNQPHILLRIFKSKIFKDVPSIANHTINLVLALLSVWLLEWVLNHLLGSEARFFDWIPIRYVINAADFAVILKFLWHLIKDFNK